MPGKANTINHKEENTGMEIKGKVHYVGVNDRNKTLFEICGRCLMVCPTTLI